MVGELRNNCSNATSVRFHLTLRDDTGRVVEADDTWPAGTLKIPAHSDYAFTINANEPSPGRRATKFHIDVTAVDEF